MSVSIIANNCMGGCILHAMGMEFDTPTINLQIFPEEYPKFCKNIRHYIECEMVEYTELSEKHKGYVERMYGDVTDVPYGLLDDVMVQFMHYRTFQEGLEAWNRRKKRIDFNNLRFLLHANNEKYAEEVKQFIALGLPNSAALTENFEVPGSYRFDVPDVIVGNIKLDAFGGYNGKPVIENGKFRREDFIRG
jgi:uncharacterized protein (DUF1919 family)